MFNLPLVQQAEETTRHVHHLLYVEKHAVQVGWRRLRETWKNKLKTREKIRFSAEKWMTFQLQARLTRGVAAVQLINPHQQLQHLHAALYSQLFYTHLIITLIFLLSSWDMMHLHNKSALLKLNMEHRVIVKGQQHTRENKVAQPCKSTWL